jgi:hypothetical protein
MSDLLKLARQALGATTVNALIALVLSGTIATAYALLVQHYYTKGYRAHEREIAGEIARINTARADLAAKLAWERMQRGLELAKAETEAQDAARAYCRENPEACGITVSERSATGWVTTVVRAQPSTCAAKCSTPASVRAALDRIN